MSGAELRIASTQPREILDLTVQVAGLVRELQDGIVMVSVPHTTVALFLSELDDELAADYVKIADKLFSGARPFSHVRNNNPNTEAHVMSAMLGTSITLSLSGGKLALGTYQRVVFFELDGPKQRTVRITHLKGG